MQIILSKQCESLTGSLGRRFGYHIQRRKDGFWAIRDSKGYVPEDGHLRFIIACAELAKSGLYIVDIEIYSVELTCALREAGHITAAWMVAYDPHDLYHADDILKFKEQFGL